jgi:thiosulfate/3-mercaptopyruvate sulfurtransferase
MNAIIFSKLKPLIIPIFGVLFIVGCAKVTNKDKDTLPYGTCEGCHTDYDKLIEVHTPDTGAPAGGCGGSAPVIDPFDRVIMEGDGYEAFKSSTHDLLKCTDCHNGVDKTSDKELAHSGDFLRHPSEQYVEKCGDCHGDIVSDFSTSLHHGTGQKRKVAMRSGLDGPEDFSQLPQHQIEGYNANCATCHGTCGNCHVVRPPLAGGGLADGHNFIKTPSMLNNCIKCHSSRGGHAYLGLASGTEPDVHLTEAGFQCIDCHSGAELHGNGMPVDHRYEYSDLPECEDCHDRSKNLYHDMHYNDFNCHVCHSQDYNNCGECHVHGDGARIPSYQDFKIALNPIPETKPGFNMVLVRRTLAAPDNWEVYGVDEYDNFEAFPTYNYTTPHNILRWTSRTDVDGDACYTNCHIRNEGGELINKELYLFMDDLLSWEVNATGSITVDDALPGIWTK